MAPQRTGGLTALGYNLAIAQANTKHSRFRHPTALRFNLGRTKKQAEIKAKHTMRTRWETQDGHCFLVPLCFGQVLMEKN